MATSTGKPLPPGSLGLPIIGETISYARDPHRFFETRFARYGPVFKTRLVFGKVVCFVGPEAFSFFVSAPHFDRGGAPPQQLQRLLHFDSLPLAGGAKHRRMRGLVLQAFGPEVLDTYVRTVERTALRYLDRWERAGEFAWVSEFKMISASICGALFTGAEPHANPGDLVQTLDRFLAGLTAFPINLPWTTYGKALRSRDELLGIIDDAISSHRQCAFDDMLTELLRARADDGSDLRPEQVRSQMLHMFFAAYGGIYRVLTLLCMNLAQDRKTMERARVEVLQTTPEGPLDSEQLAKLSFLEQVTKEVRRHNRIFASTFVERVTEPFEYQDYNVPKDWKAMGGIYTTMQDSDTFTNPDQFDPDRFGPVRAEHLRQENSYVPHRGGSMEGHRCPGEDLTTSLMKTVAVLLLRDYSWELPPQNLELDNESSPLPRDGLRVRFRRQS